MPEPPRLNSGYRLYPNSAVRRVRFIKRAQEIGFSLAEIRELLSLRIDARRERAEVRSVAENKIADIDAEDTHFESYEGCSEPAHRAMLRMRPGERVPDTRKYRFGGGVAMTGWRTGAILPGIGVSLMPKLICPLCWPAYAGLLSAVGLGFFVSARNLLFVTELFLIMAVAAMAFRARRRRGLRPCRDGNCGKHRRSPCQVLPRIAGNGLCRRIMNQKHRIEIYSAGCATCKETIRWSGKSQARTMKSIFMTCTRKASPVAQSSMAFAACPPW